MEWKNAMLLAALVGCLALALPGCPDEDDPPPPEPTEPVIQSVSPVSGSTAGGITVWVFGENFDPAGGTTTVDFGSTAATGVTVHSSGAISCTAPAGTAGSVNVTVTNPNADVAVLAGGFSYGAEPVLDSASIQLQEVDPYGCNFASDMGFALDASMGRTLFANQEATVDATDGASVVALNLNLTPVGPDTSYTTFVLAKTDLLRSDGTTAVLGGDTWGAYMSEATTDDLLVVSATLAFLTVSAANENDPPYLANLVVFNPTTGALLQPVINLAVPYTHPVSSQVRSDGSSIAADTWVQTNPSGLAYVAGTGTAGKLYVSMSNLYDASGFPYPSVFNPGTVQVFGVDTSSGTPVTAPAGAVLYVSKWNPTHLTLHTTATTGDDYVLVTEAGACGYYGSTGYGNSNPPYVYASQTDGAIEIIDPATDAFVSWDPDGAGSAPARTTVDLGLAAPSFDDVITTATDASGRVVGFLGSSFYGQIYAVELTGLDSAVIDGTAIKPLRNAYNPIFVFSNEGTTHDFCCSVAVSPNGAYAFVGDFNGGKIHVVKLPDDLADGTYEVNPEYFETPFAPTAIDGGLPRLGKILFRTGTYAGPEAFILVNNVDFDFPADDENYGAVATIDCQGRVK